MIRKKIVVIGSGLAGTLIANALAKNCDVTVLEIGPKSGRIYPGMQIHNKELAVGNTFCYGAGGTTNLWHNGLIPIRTSDVSIPAFRSVLEESAAFRDRAAAALHFPLPSFSQEFDQAHAEAASLGEGIGKFKDGVDCLIYPHKYAPLTVNSAVTAAYNVEGLDFVADSNSVSHVSFRIDGQRHSISADYVVVSAGGLGSPQVLSNILPLFGGDFQSPGKGFIDHPMGFVGKFKFPRKIASLISKFALSDKGAYASRNIVRLRSPCGAYTAGAFFRPAITMDNSLAIYKYKSLLGTSVGEERIRAAMSPKVFHPDIIAEILSHLFSVQVPTRTYSVLFMGEQKRGNNRVFHDDRGLNVDWTITDDELRVYRQMIERLTDMLSGVAEESNIAPDLSSDWLWSAAHHSGATSLGDNPQDLIDRDLKIKCTDNVFVCDASVIQEHSYANTGLTIGQLALRLADRLGR